MRRVETAYDRQGNAYLLTNYDATTSGNIVNQVQRAFNGLGQMTTEWQSHSGAVNTSTSPKVQYAYSEMPSGANHSRPVSMTYPNGRVIDFNYGVALDDAIGRLSALKDGATTLESYDYLGLGTVVKRGHAQSGVDLTFIKASGEGNGDAGDQYTGLDRFGRIVDQRWRTSSVEKDRYQYTYDRNGNRTAETNTLNSSFNEAYSYDNLNQLTGFNRNAGARTQSWDYDALGNWESVTTDASTQTRTHNRQNEITAVSGATSPVFDAAGNMTTDETGKQYVYDAWNRLVTVKNSGGTTIASYAYDPLTRRVSETASSVTTDLYYSSQWQVVEERVSGAATKSYVWSPVYVDAMVARDRDTDANGSLDERLYLMHDANFNVTGLVNTSGTVVERYTYDPFGAVTVHDGSWSVTTTAYVWQYLHQGGRLSGQSGLYSFRYREYSPTLGRWVTMDPISNITLDRNTYSTNFNNQISYTDGSGLYPIPSSVGQFLSVGKVDFRTVTQTKTGANCWYVATLIAFAYQRPDDIKRMIKMQNVFGSSSQSYGSYASVTLHKSGYEAGLDKDKYYQMTTVSVSIAEIMSADVISDGLWAKAITAGIAKLGYHTGTGPGIGKRYFEPVLKLLTGNGFAGTTNMTGLWGLDRRLIGDSLANKKIVVANTFVPVEPWLVNFHAYAVVKKYNTGAEAKKDNPNMKIDCVGPYYVIINPWGTNPKTLPPEKKANPSKFGPAAILIDKYDLDNNFFHVQVER